MILLSGILFLVEDFGLVFFFNLPDGLFASCDRVSAFPQRLLSRELGTGFGFCQSAVE